MKIYKRVLAAAAVVCVALPAMAEPSSSEFMDWARRGMLVANSGSADSAEVDTLAIFDLGGQRASLGGVYDANRDGIADTTFEEHLIGADYWTVCLRVRNPLGRCDSLWVHVYSETGSGPHVNADGSLVLIDNSSAADTYGIWGVYRFATQDTTAKWVDYRLPITRARGTAYVMGRFLHTKSDWWVEVWKGSDR